MIKIKRRSVLLIFILGLVSIFLLPLFFTQPFLSLLTSYLVIEDSLERCDLIFVPSGGLPFRFLKAIALLKQGWAEKIVLVISTPSPLQQKFNQLYPQFSKERLLTTIIEQENLEENQLYLLKNSKSTYLDTQRLLEFYRAQPFTKAIVVTSPYHCRRTLITLRKIFKNRPVKFISRPLFPPQSYSQLFVEKDDWLVQIFEEYFKLLYYYLRYFTIFSPPEKSPETSSERTMER
jgi:uncharacterized SAM-binding protein YcdF (DUF218 family)